MSIYLYSSFLYQLFIELSLAVISGLYFTYLLQPKLKRNVQITLWCEIAGVLTLIISFNLIFRIVAVILFEFLFILFTYKDKFLKKLLFFVLNKLVFLVCIFVTFFIEINGHFINLTESNSDNAIILLYAIVSSVILLPLVEIIKIIDDFNNRKNIDIIWLMVTQIIIGIGELEVAKNLSFETINFYGFTELGPVFAFSVGIVAVNVSMGIYVLRMIEKQPTEDNRDYIEELSNMEYKYYEMSVENDKKLLAIRHDISNHIQTVYSLFENGENQKGMELINELKERYLQVDRMVYCNNPVVNIILSNKRSEAEKSGIEVHIKVKESLVDIPVSDFDLSTVICNLIDNAIRGCICSEQSHPRMIIEIMNKNNYLVIRILNSCKITMNIDGTDKIETTKSKSQTHGIGMPIIAGIAKKYKGDFVATAQNGIFTATVVLSIK